MFGKKRQRGANTSEPEMKQVIELVEKIRYQYNVYMFSCNQNKGSILRKSFEARYADLLKTQSAVSSFLKNELVFISSLLEGETKDAELKERKTQFTSRLV